MGGLRQGTFAGPQQVLDYVGRYTHRVAISNHRLLNMENAQVRFRWEGYRDNNQQKTRLIGYLANFLSLPRRRFVATPLSLALDVCRQMKQCVLFYARRDT